MTTIHATETVLPNLPGLAEKLHAVGIHLSFLSWQPERHGVRLANSSNIHGDLPTIAVCKGDSSDLYPHVAARLNMPCVVGAVKSYRIADCLLPTIDMRHFVTHLERGANWPEPQPNPPPPCRVRPWLEYVPLPQMERFAQVGAEYVRAGTVNLWQRTLTASFDGTMHYTAGEFVGPAVTRHRMALAPLASPRRLSRPEYIRRLRSSRCVVSPWGYGEACWRDWEAILCGASVVKPASPWVVCESGYFQSEHVTWCKPDWSDLAEAIDAAASKTTAQRLSAIEWALAERARAADIVAASLSAIIKEASQ
jgi:hypothetical protein